MKSIIFYNDNFNVIDFKLDDTDDNVLVEVLVLIISFNADIDIILGWV